jgi:hypothetical protein
MDQGQSLGHGRSGIVRWQPGDIVLRRDVWRTQPMVGWGGIVVADSPELLALYMPEGSPFAFAPDFFGEPHPWSHKDRWEGNGVLQLQRPGEMHAVWVFWESTDRRLGAWYVNLQEPFRRTSLGFDTQDLELDIVVSPDGDWRLKDDEKLEGWIERGGGRRRRSPRFAPRARGSKACSTADAAGGATNGPTGSPTRTGRRRSCGLIGTDHKTRVAASSSVSAMGLGLSLGHRLSGQVTVLSCAMRGAVVGKPRIAQT